MYIDALTIAGFVADFVILAVVIATTVPGLDILRNKETQTSSN